ncbi:protein GPR107 [Contarinia nasturtii]|uniref:protein GPR107 n=1 Tax=Contarinia nasturtii TaxID=265458 RepID=UPI0012D3B7BC|nr:protein GPR107 [Contarinia nasturtii]
MLLKIAFLIAATLQFCVGRKHHLEIEGDVRRYISLSTFGFFNGGTLDVNLYNFRVDDGREGEMFGLTLDKTRSDAMNPFIDNHQDKCILEEPASMQHNGPIAYLSMDLKNKQVTVNCSKDWHNIHIYKDRTQLPNLAQKRDESNLYANMLLESQRRKRSAEPSQYEEAANARCNNIRLPMYATKMEGLGFSYYNFSFVMYVLTENEEGLYNLYFHACPNYQRNMFALNFNINIEEANKSNFLSAGEMPLPELYFMMSLIFFLSGLFWLFLLKKSTHTVFRIHYIMSVLVFLKSLSLMFHSINYHYIDKEGEHIEAWAILYYVTHLLKGAVLFITIVLIGTGWTFIKHILADKDKKLFMIVIPLQILANVAEIIIDESEEGDIERATWTNIFILVDLICCGAILFPVVWSIRHLQDASSTDGKAATNLKKLRLFRQFYIMIVCYIYFTRIIVYLLRATVPFQYVWLDEMFKESATYIFYALTAYKFRPVPIHPYFAEDSDDEQDDEVEILYESGLTQGLKNRNMIQSSATLVAVPKTHAKSNAHNADGDDDEKENLISNRESSHEYD